MLSIITFIIESFKELVYEVTWPSAKELQKLSFLFLIGVIICATIVGGLNVYLLKITMWFYKSF